MRSAIKDHKKSAPSTSAIEDTHKNSELQVSTDRASIDESITISKEMFQQLAQRVNGRIQASNNNNDEIRALQKVGKITVEEKLKEYSATVAKLSDKVSYLLEQIEKHNVEDEKIAKFLANKKGQRDEEKKKKRKKRL